MKEKENEDMELIKDAEKALFKFTHTFSQHADILENGTRIKTKGPDYGCFLVTSSNGWNKGKHHWSIKCISIEYGSHMVGIGLTTDYSVAMQQYGNFSSSALNGGKNVFYSNVVGIW
eukprot:555344_1